MKDRLRTKIMALHDSVARQQALFLKLLPRDVQDAFADTYLLFRMLDTIEDSPLEPQMRFELLESAANDFLLGLAKAADLNRENSRIEPHYVNLFIEIEDVLSFHSKLDDDTRHEIESTGRCMAAGMLKFARRFHDASSRGNGGFIESMTELDEYCQIAAGCVGELNTRIFFAHDYLDAGTEASFLPGGAALGKYLQMVNIMRDLRDDGAARMKSHVPNELTPLSPPARITTLVAAARRLEPSIESYLGAFPKNACRDYCAALYATARAHHLHFEAHPESVLAGQRVPATILIGVLPWKLRWHFAVFNMLKALGCK